MKKTLIIVLNISILMTLLCLSVSAAEIRLVVGTETQDLYLYDESSGLGKNQVYDFETMTTTTLDVPEESETGSPVYFADGDNYVIFKFQLGESDVSAVVSMLVANEYQLSASKDAKDWTIIAEETNVIHSRENLDRRNFDISEFLKENASKTIYIQLTDYKTDDGWGGFTTGEIAVYSSDKEFTVNKKEMGDSSLRKAPANLADLVTFKEAPVVSEAAEETTEAPAQVAATTEHLPSPETGDANTALIVISALALSFGVLLRKKAVLY